MGFFAPWFLAGAAAVGLPIWLHLLKKHRSTPLPFASLMFFEQHIQSSIKHKRLRYLVLFVLRTALVALIALAFAKPYIHQKALPASRAGEVSIMAVDNSLSMRAGDRLAHAKQMAKAAIDRWTRLKLPTRAPRSRNWPARHGPSRNRCGCPSTCSFFPTCSSPACRRISTICD